VANETKDKKELRISKQTVKSLQQKKTSIKTGLQRWTDSADCVGAPSSPRPT
jgi:hypothetical protein